MVRVKFLVFALLVLGLWLAHLFLLAPGITARAIDLAASESAAAAGILEGALEARRVELQKAALRIAGAGEVAGSLKSGPPTAERFAPIRAAAGEALPEALRSAAIIGWANESGVIFARGEGEPSTGAEELDLSAVAAAGADGAAQLAFGVPHVFTSVRFAGERDKVLGTIVLGLPSLADGVADAAAAKLKAGAVGILVGGKLAAQGGPQKALVERALPQLNPGQSAVVSRGEVSSLGPVRLPLLTAGDAMGGQAALLVGSRQAVGGTPFEVVALASVEPMMEALGDYQRVALFAFFALLGLTLVFTALMGGGRPSEQSAAAAPQPEATSLAAPMPAPPPGAPEQESLAAALPMPELPPAPEASPEDFPFGAPPQHPDPATSQEPAFAAGMGGGDPFEALGSPQSNPFDQHPSPFADSSPPAWGDPAPDPFAAPPPPAAAPPEEGDSTRVANVPQDLLRASASLQATDPLVPSPGAGLQFAAALPRVEPVAAPAPSPEDQHFQEVFRDFLSTRERCGEAADGLTFEKFAVKLRKNRDQLIQKYGCRSVRFQVYVKDGKAALKATPLKD